MSLPFFLPLLKINIMAENFKIVVGKAFKFDNHIDTMDTGGDVNDKTIRLYYQNGTGVSFIGNQILYTEGNIGGPADFFQIMNINDVNLTTNGILSVYLAVQTNVAVGTIITKTISIGGSLPFDITITYL